jgi:hypothetical protein
MFFSEERNEKTFANWFAPVATRALYNPGQGATRALLGTATVKVHCRWYDTVDLQ